MKTFFAPPERVENSELENQIRITGNSPVMSGLLESISGLLAVLNEKRQVVALNDTLLSALGLDDPKSVLGLRPGETLHCIYAEQGPGGCGTGKLCASCGAVIAIVAALASNEPAEETCAIRVMKDNQEIDLVFNVQAKPVVVDDYRFLLLFLRDISQEEQRAALERTFYHDMNNMLATLTGASQILQMEADPDLARTIYDTAMRLANEIKLQKYLTQSIPNGYEPFQEKIAVDNLLSELVDFFNYHPTAKDKKFDISDQSEGLFFKGDSTILMKILCNMVINAFEATDKWGTVKLTAGLKDGYLFFDVWNKGEIPETIAGRIFQKHFSTKNAPGRGIGTFSMKLFGEKILGGNVYFTTSPNGTIFSFTLPI